MSKIKFLDVEVSNFLAFGKEPITLKLDVNEIRLILGVNHDVGDEGQSRNGVGKSSCLNAIVFALYGRGLSDKLKNDDYVNYFNEKKCMVKLRFQKGDKTYRIERGRKPAVLDLYETSSDGVETTISLDSMGNTDKYIESLVGRSYDVFMVDHFLAPKKESFFAKKPAEQRQIIEEILKLDTLTQRAEMLKKIRSEYEIDVKVFSRDVENAVHVNQKIANNVSRMQLLLAEYEEKRADKISGLEREITELDLVDTKVLLNNFDQKERLGTKIKSISAEIVKYFDEATLLREKNDLLSSNILKLQETKVNYINATNNTVTYESTIKETKLNAKATLDNLPSLIEIDTHIENIEEITKLSNSITYGRFETDKLHKTIETKVNALSDLNDKLTHLRSGTCNSCKQTYINRAEENRLEGLIAPLELEIEEFKTKLSHTVSTNTQTEHKLNELSEQYKDIKLSDLKEARESVVQAQKTLSQVDASNPFTAQAEELERIVNSVEFKNEFESTTEELARLATLKTDVASKISELRETEKTLKAELATIDCGEFNSRDDVAKIPSIIDSIKSEIVDLASSENPYRVEIEQANAGIVNVEESEAKVAGIEDDIRHCNYLIKMLTDSKSFIRKRMVDQYIPFLNNKINEYVQILGLVHVIEIEPDLTVSMQYMSKSGVSYHSLSEGERLRVDVSTAMAFRDLMRMLGSETNLLIIDELFDSGSDASFINRAYKFIRDRSNNILMISHREEFLDSVHARILVEKRDGFATVTETKIMQ